jgi:hypothetical protein
MYKNNPNSTRLAIMQIFINTFDYLILVKFLNHETNMTIDQTTNGFMDCS